VTAAAALALILGAGAARAAEPPPPSRPAEEGCVWRRMTEPAVGIALWVEKCDFGFRTVDYTASAKDKELFEVLHDTGIAAPDSHDPIVYMFVKKAGEPIAAAIRRVSLPSVRAERRAHCRAVPAERYRLPAGREAYEFAPDDEAAILKDAEGEIPDAGCGKFGVDYDSQSYFEYHPKENPRRFAFVLFGQDEHPGFDENSLTFLP
jgi:hypothetical protein